ncbi:hypothetical protein BY996DRAFT_6489763 [Phakopsora pachyrhizi]|nr:hypothetical protein BY996DRAFT_6489763 [Phakopsora pachyrhizi]
MVVIGRMLQNNLLERNCDRDDNSVEKVREEKVPGQYSQLKTFEIQDMVIKFSEVELKTEDGRVALNAARHNGMVHGHLNKLSPSNGEPAKLFGSNLKEIRLDLEQLGFKLDRLESNLGKPYFDFNRIESILNRPIEDVQFKINSAEQWIKESIYGRAVHIDRLRLEFINEINCQRMIEFFLEKGMEQTDLSNPISAGEHLCNIYLVELALSLSMMTLRAQERHNLVNLILRDDDEPSPIIFKPWKELRSDGEISSAGFDPMKPISKRLEELRQRSNNLFSILNNNLKASQSVFENMRLRKTHLKRFLQVFGQLNDLDCKSWIDKDSNTQHSSLTAQSNFVDAISTLKDLKREINDLGDSDHSTVMELIMEF